MKAFSELTSASQVNNSDLLAISQESGNDFVSKKTTVKEVADFANQNLADEYDSTSTYAVDDFVMYESALYKCVTAVSSAEAFDPTKWTQVVVTDEMGSGGGGNANERVLSYAEYQALSEAQKMNNTTYYIYDINGDGSQFQPIIFSKTEREIGVWIDGKPLYEKTYELSTAFVINAHTWGTTSIDVSFVDKFIGEADIVTSGGQGYVCFTDVDNSNYLQLYNPRQDAGIGVKFIIIRYTKKADTAGSGTWTPQGVPAVHYSTDEQIIGTYFGDPLYQKTIVLASGVSIADSWTTIYTDSLIGDISQLVDVKYNNVDNKGVYGVLNFKPNGNNLQAVYPISGGLNVLAGARFTLQYTKS